MCTISVFVYRRASELTSVPFQLSQIEYHVFISPCMKWAPFVAYIHISCFYWIQLFAAPWRNLHVQSFCVYACVVPAFDIWMSLCIQSSSYSIYLLQCTRHEMVHEATRPAPDWNTGHVKAQLSWAHCRHFVSKRNIQPFCRNVQNIYLFDFPDAV